MSPTTTRTALFGTVIVVEKRLDVADFRRVEIHHFADDGVTVRFKIITKAYPMSERQRRKAGYQHVVCALLLDNVSLIFEILHGNRQRTHAVGFEPQREVQSVCRHHLVIVGSVFVSSNRCCFHPPVCTKFECSLLSTFSDPWNIMCSKRWAKPLLPISS